jgi:predicted lipoprotein with Yx(FWY)xxD motif
MKWIVIASTAALTASAFAQEAQTTTPFVNWKGMTIYVFDRDPPGKSECDGQCAVEWPPMLAAPDAQKSVDWSTITRSDGNKQWAYKGRPLYTSHNDEKPGDTNGDGINNVWHVARP